MAYATANLTSTSDYVELSPSGTKGMVCFISFSNATQTVAIQRSVDGSNFRNLTSYTATPAETPRLDVSSGTIRIRPTAVTGGTVVAELSDA